MAYENLSVLFDRICRTFPTRIALRIGGHQITYTELLQLVEKWAQELAHLHFKSRERVLLVIGPYLDFIALWFALWKIECVPIPLEVSIPPLELSRAIVESQAHWFVTSSSFVTSMLYRTNTKAFITRADFTYVRTDYGHSIEEVSSENALIFYTSGTTGTPKCVIHSHASIAASVTSLVQAMNLTERDVVLTPILPMLPAALGTVVLQTLCIGATLVLPTQAIPGQVLREIAVAKVTVFFAVPYLYRLLSTSMRLRKYDIWSSVRLCLSSSAMLDQTLFATFHGCTHLPIRSAYCSSEIGACTFNSSSNLTLVRDSVGQTLPGVELQIMDQMGHILPVGNEGQIVVGGSHLATGYFNRPDLQSQVFDRGWVKTGDIGMLDHRGFLSLSGRLSDTINISGYLVNPREVEQVILNHPAVSEAIVYGIADSKLGEIVAAKVVVNEHSALLIKDELIQLCIASLVHYKVPHRIDFVDELPKSRYDKIKRPPKTLPSEDLV